MRVKLGTTFQVSSIVLTNFRQGWEMGVGGNPPNLKTNPKKAYPD